MKVPLLSLVISKIVSAVTKGLIFVNLHPLVAARAAFSLYPGWQLGRGEWDSRLPLRLRRKLWERMKAPSKIQWLDGLCVHVYPGNETSRSIFITGYYEPNEFYALDKILKQGMTFIDAGANIGLYTLFASKKVGEQGIVVAIEPSSREFQRLKINVEMNALSNVRLVQVAVSHCPRQARLLVAAEEHSGHNTLGNFGYESVVQESEEWVRVERLDDIAKQERLDRIDVIKMDIEGAELFALQGATDTLAQFHPIVLLELSDRTLGHQECRSEQIWEFLTEGGYRIYTFDRGTGLPVPAQQRENFESENIIAVHKLFGGQLPW